MTFTTEIFLTKKAISKEEWLEFIKALANYNGILRKWKLIITNNKNHLQFYVKTKYKLPATINNLEAFLLKTTKVIDSPKASSTNFTIPKTKNNIIDLITYNEIRNKGTLFQLEMDFRKLFDEEIMTNIYYFVNKNAIIKKYHVLFTLPQNILATNFDDNKRYFYRSSPKYLDSNKILPLLTSDANNALFKVETFPYLQGDFYLNQNSYSFAKHSLILGSSGSGKSKFISLLINNTNKDANLQKKYKFVVIDPHAALEKDIGGLGKVIDFQSTTDSINLFLNNTNQEIIATTEILLDLLKSLISDSNAKLERVLRHSLYLLLSDNNFNFQNLRKLILDIEYRNCLIKKYKYNLPMSVIEFFLKDFNDIKTKSYGEAIAPIIGFIDEMEMVPLFNEQNSKQTVNDVIKENFLVLFSLDVTKFGQKITKTIAGLLMQQLLTIIQSQQLEEHLIFVVDEVSVVENPILGKFLAEARKFNLSVILIGQYFNQISNELKSSIFANVINYYIFRISQLDANILVDNFNLKIPTDNSKESKIKLLTELNNRECIIRCEENGVLMPACKGITLDYQSIPRLKRKDLKINMDKIKPNPPNKVNFQINSTVNLKDVLLETSTNKKGNDENDR